ncbi:tRNA glutamyl-Q(34) synthetase GluQRS [Marinagarivorans algicola]|uniref:tRNA glutamyl-Q(34) synthetase GluQRS n=1 Tax=Marinagarivorans algicola TaxID=1513270 RepID=UPI0009E7552A|nr:tRNA glutamyl-Q(34) synthetase GluQRS [Marinagarivorans algicola]
MPAPIKIPSVPPSPSQTTSRPYIGRFAPSPSGALHLGSLACALASYFDAKVHQGLWLVRMEDIDPPREPAGAADAIVECLIKHELHWDCEILYQSTRTAAYQRTLAQLKAKQLTYYCQCSRKILRTLNGVYDGHCRYLQHTDGAIKFNIQHASTLGLNTQVSFIDTLCGTQQQDLLASGDFIIHRKDGLFAYQLAVITDDIAQGITHIVRGDDLLDVTFNQLMLFETLDYQAPQFTHIPVLLDDRGYKLSKQHGAPAVDINTPQKNIYTCLQQMGFTPPPHANTKQLLSWGIDAWHVRCFS